MKKIQSNLNYLTNVITSEHSSRPSQYKAQTRNNHGPYMVYSPRTMTTSPTQMNMNENNSFYRGIVEDVIRLLQTELNVQITINSFMSQIKALVYRFKEQEEAIQRINTTYQDNKQYFNSNYEIQTNKIGNSVSFPSNGGMINNYSCSKKAAPNYQSKEFQEDLIKYKDFCNQMMRQHNIKSFESFKQNVSSLFKSNTKHNKYLSGLKKVLCKRPTNLQIK